MRVNCGKLANNLCFGGWLINSCSVDNFCIQFHWWNNHRLSTNLCLVSPLKFPQSKVTNRPCYRAAFPQFPQHLLLTILIKN